MNEVHSARADDFHSATGSERDRHTASEVASLRQDVAE